MAENKTKKISKKDKLKAQKVVDGQLEELPIQDQKKNSNASLNPSIPKYRTLDELFNFKGAQYKTLNETEYLTSLAELNITDLQNEMWRCGLTPHINRNIMIERLSKQFRRVTGSLLNTLKPIQVHFDKKAMDILAEGKNKPC